MIVLSPSVLAWTDWLPLLGRFKWLSQKPLSQLRLVPCYEMVPNLCFQKLLSQSLLQKLSLRCFNLLCLWVCSCLCITSLPSAFFVQINWELWKMSTSSGLALACKEFPALTVALLLAVMLLSAVLLNLLQLYHAFPEKFQLWWHF